MSGFEAPPTVYPSKRDGWLMAILWVSIAVMIGAAAVAWSSSEPFLFRLMYAAVILSVAGFTYWIMSSTRYELDDRSLVARSGPFRWTVPLESIRGVTPTRNPLSAPACSLDRLQIDYPGRALGLLISPEDTEGFLRDLRLRCPQLVDHGDRLVLRP